MMGLIFYQIKSIYKKIRCEEVNEIDALLARYMDMEAKISEAKISEAKKKDDEKKDDEKEYVEEIR